MNLIKRFPYANIYGDDRKQRAVLGGIPNVPIDTKGTLEPLDNEVEIITTNPFAKYVIKRGPFSIGFHDKINNKYGVAIRLRTGETLIKRAIGDSACTPTVIDNRTLQWKYANGSWIREYATEKKVKEIIFQKAGQVIKFKYTVNGFTIKKIGQQIEFYKGNRLAFVLQRPYYCTKDGEFISYVPISWQKIGDDWEITYPAPAQDKYIDPTIVFGEGAGYIGGDHKDAALKSGGPDRSFGEDALAAVRVPADRVTLFRFSLTGHIPVDAIVNTSVLSVSIGGLGVAGTVNASSLTVPWGVNPVHEGTTQNPAAFGQPTFNNSFAWNNPGLDVDWGAGDWAASLPYNIAEANFVLAGGEAIGTFMIFALPIMTAAWILNDVLNYGFCLYMQPLGGNNSVNTQEAANAVLRPYLTVDYTVDEAVRRVLQSHMGLSNPLGIV